MGIGNEKVHRLHVSSWESYFKLSTDWGRQNGKVRLLEDVEVTVYFSLVTSLSDSCCLWMQNSCWVLKLCSRKVAGPDSSSVGRPWGGLLFTRCPHTPVPSAWPPGGMDCWEDSPEQEPVGSGLCGAHTWPPLQGASACSLWAPFSGLGASCPGREQATSRMLETERGPPWYQEAGASETPAPPHRQELSQIKPAGAEFPAAPGHAGCQSHRCEGLLEHVCVREWK